MHYTNRKILVTNASAEVMLADSIQTGDTCRVILKTVLPELTDEVMSRLCFSQSLAHKGIQQIVDFGVCSNRMPKRHYVASRYEPSVTLTQVLTRLDSLQKKAPIPFVVHVLHEVCSALEYIHETAASAAKTQRVAVCHGCVCPDNVLIGMDGDIRLADAGIGDIVRFRFTGMSLVDNRVTAFDHPEATRGSVVRQHHEMYSAGLLLLCTLLGRNHFDGFCTDQKMRRLKAVSDYFPSIPAELEKIVKKATRLGSTGRFVRYSRFNSFMEGLLRYSKKESVAYDREMTGLLVYALFNHLENEPLSHHELQRQKAITYIQKGSDNALKVLLGNLLNIDAPTVPFVEEHHVYMTENGLSKDNDLLEHLEADFEVMSPDVPDERETLYLEELPLSEDDDVSEPDYSEDDGCTDAGAGSEGNEMRVNQEMDTLPNDVGEDIHHQKKTLPGLVDVQNDSSRNAEHEAGELKGETVRWAVSGTAHPFVKIVKGTGVVDADVYSARDIQQLPEKQDVTEEEGGQVGERVERTTPFDSFSRLLSGCTGVENDRTTDIFFNLLKKEKKNNG